MRLCPPERCRTDGSLARRGGRHESGAGGPVIHGDGHRVRIAAAFIGTIFAQENKAAAKAHWRQVADQITPSLPKLATLAERIDRDPALSV